jgi:hypothetical protein
VEAVRREAPRSVEVSPAWRVSRQPARARRLRGPELCQPRRRRALLRLASARERRLLPLPVPSPHRHASPAPCLARALRVLPVQPLLAARRQPRRATRVKRPLRR